MPIFHPAVYEYICTGEYLGLIRDNNCIPYGLVRMLLNEVCTRNHATETFHVIVMFYIQIDAASTDIELQSLFTNENENGHDFEILMNDTGFKKPLPHVLVKEKEDLKSVLREFHSIIISKAEVDQFIEGLKCLNVLENIQKYPSLMSPFFCQQASSLTKGIRA